MACLTCENTKLIPACATNLVLGKIDHISQDIYIFVKNITTGYEVRQEATSSAVGVVTMDLTDPDSNFYSPNHSYEVWVTFQDTTTTEKVNITLGGEEFDCFVLTFEKIYDDTPAPIATTTHILQLDDNYTEIAPQFWYDSNNEVLLNVANPTTIVKWLNKGSGNDCDQQTLAEQPAIQAAGLNGQDVVRFVATTFFDVSVFTYATTYFHAFILVRASANTVLTENGLFYHGDSSGQIYMHSIVVDNLGEFQYWINGTGNGASLAIVSSEGENVIGSWSVLEVEYNAGDVNLFLNGLPVKQSISVGGVIPATLPDFTQGTNDMYVGATPFPLTVPNGMVGDIREIRVFGSAITANQQQQEVLNMLAKI